MDLTDSQELMDVTVLMVLMELMVSQELWDQEDSEVNKHRLLILKWTQKMNAAKYLQYTCTSTCNSKFSLIQYNMNCAFIWSFILNITESVIDLCFFRTSWI